MWPSVNSQVLAVVFDLYFVSIIDRSPEACVSLIRNSSVDEISRALLACVNKNICEEAHEDKAHRAHRNCRQEHGAIS